MENKCLFIIKASMIRKIPLDEILFVERAGRKIRVVTKDESIEYNEKLANVLMDLDDRFYPCLEGCYINFEKLVSLFEGEITFENGQSLWIGRRNFQRTLRDFATYARKKEKVQNSDGL